MIKTAGDAFEPNDKHVYFLASGVGRLMSSPLNDFYLIAVNELTNEKDMEIVERWMDEGKKILIDSGIFALAMEHAKRHDVSHDVALNLAPNEIDGFDELLEQYLYVIDRFGDRAWGYIELDQGGRENKIKTRAMLEDKGLRPIPVYHPFGDGWDYFDYLAQNYDRICFGNIVMADRYTRLRLIATAWERKQKYPHLWIHMLGLTPNQWLNAYPTDSADSSSWLVGVRWSASWKSFVAQKTWSNFPVNMRYKLGDSDGEAGADKFIGLAGYQYKMLMDNWRRGQNDYEDIR